MDQRLLDEHLRCVSSLAGESAAVFVSAEWGAAGGPLPRTGQVPAGIPEVHPLRQRILCPHRDPPVIERHSNLEAGNETPESRIAAGNWDVPVVVTTNVQFFESHYAAKPFRCRKLHNIANSVVILDEAKLLPPEHLAPILNALHPVIDRYNVTVALAVGFTSSSMRESWAMFRPTPFSIWSK